MQVIIKLFGLYFEGLHFIASQVKRHFSFQDSANTQSMGHVQFSQEPGPLASCFRVTLCSHSA